MAPSAVTLVTILSVGVVFCQTQEPIKEVVKHILEDDDFSQVKIPVLSSDEAITTTALPPILRKRRSARYPSQSGGYYPQYQSSNYMTQQSGQSSNTICSYLPCPPQNNNYASGQVVQAYYPASSGCDQSAGQGCGGQGSSYSGQGSGGYPSQQNNGFGNSYNNGGGIILIPQNQNGGYGNQYGGYVNQYGGNGNQYGGSYQKPMTTFVQCFTSGPVKTQQTTLVHNYYRPGNYQQALVYFQALPLVQIQVVGSTYMGFYQSQRYQYIVSLCKSCSGGHATITVRCTSKPYSYISRKFVFVPQFNPVVYKQTGCVSNCQ